MSTSCASVSVVVPVYNNEASLDELVRRLVAVLEAAQGAVRDRARRRRQRRRVLEDHHPQRARERSRRRHAPLAQLRPAARDPCRPPPRDGRHHRAHGRRPPGPARRDPARCSKRSTDDVDIVVTTWNPDETEVKRAAELPDLPPHLRRDHRRAAPPQPRHLPAVHPRVPRRGARLSRSRPRCTAR